MAQATDTVPAMLTPGEYVVNKSAAQAFGYGNLKNINRYAAGGIVKNGRGNYGVLPNPGGTSPNAALQNMNTQIGGVNNALTGLQSSLNSTGQASANSAAQSARNTAARRKATKNLGKNITGHGYGKYSFWYLYACSSYRSYNCSNENSSPSLGSFDCRTRGFWSGFGI